LVGPHPASPEGGERSLWAHRGFGSNSPSPLEGEGRGGGWFSDPLMDPHPQSLPSRGREAQELKTIAKTSEVNTSRKGEVGQEPKIQFENPRPEAGVGSGIIR